MVTPTTQREDRILVLAILMLAVITMTAMILVATDSMKALDASTLTVGPLVLLGFVIGSRLVRR